MGFSGNSFVNKLCFLLQIHISRGKLGTLSAGKAGERGNYEM
jgi:hypothetical protein